jgi:hypothetical protein
MWIDNGNIRIVLGRQVEHGFEETGQYVDVPAVTKEHLENGVIEWGQERFFHASVARVMPNFAL